MLQTLLKIGEWQSQGKSEWDRFLDFPKVEKEDKKGNTIKNYTLPIVFDLDENEVVVESINLKEYDERDVANLFLLKTLSARNKKIYGTVNGNNLKFLFNTFFGNDIDDDKCTEGDLIESIKKDFPDLLTPEFSKILLGIANLKIKFLDIVAPKDKESKNRTLDVKNLKNYLALNKNEAIAIIYIQIKSDSLGINEPKPFTLLKEYRNFLKAKFLSNNSKNNNAIKLCYASGEEKEGILSINLDNRYSLNKMFVDTTQNYITQFDKKNINHNYQVSVENQKYLDYASSFLLNNGFTTRIANVNHVIIPEFQSRTEVNLQLALEEIKRKSDLLFNFRSMDKLAKNIKEETFDIFWINFVAFEADGKSFKATETIKDVSNFHFSKVIEIFEDIDWQLREVDFIDWERVMTEYNDRRLFNLNSIYSLIPLRKDKEKKNKALDLFKAILENRPVEKRTLYDYFCELMLCHWFERYNSYTNVQNSSRDYFGITVRNSVFKYLAFFQILKQLKLIDMEANDTNQPNLGLEEETSNKYELAIHEFFRKMNLNEEQKAMFYLGRMLNKVEYIQKGKNKTVIHKVNFNGMDKDDIERLRIGLMEKAKQYSAIGKVIFIDNKFGNHFDTNNWKMPAQEAVFFLLTGYSFGVGIKDAEELEQNEIATEEEFI